MATSITMRLREPEAEALEFIASYLDRSKSYLMLQAMKEFIKNTMEEIADERDAGEALKAWKDESMETYTTEEIAAFINQHCPR